MHSKKTMKVLVLSRRLLRCVLISGNVSRASSRRKVRAAATAASPGSRGLAELQARDAGTLEET